MCDVDTGQCQCRENIEGLKCDILPNGTFVNVVVTIEVEDIVTNNKTKVCLYCVCAVCTVCTV